MNDQLHAAFERLSPTQRDAVMWGNGAALVLAGPGVGKTTVLTVRLARLLEESRGKNFRVLALTFTTKAGDEMRTRVEELVPGLTDRAVIGTFHSFCAQILRLHGSHLGIRSDFTIYDQTSDRQVLLREALRAAAATGEAVSAGDVRWLETIDSLRKNLVDSSRAAKRFRDPATGAKVAQVHAIYERALRDRNATDFDGLILDTCLLAHKVPAVAARIRQSYPYWMIDEFQDTSLAQYRLVRFLAGETFRNVFVVADDDQIIYQWNGASYQQLVRYRDDFKPELFQLVENRRCPPDVVAAANKLIRHNVDRTPDKKPLVAIRTGSSSTIATRVFENEEDEAKQVAAAIASAGRATWGDTVVLGRARATLGPVLKELHANGVKASIATRRDRWASPQFAWLQAALDQALRPGDEQIFIALVGAANRIANTDADAALLRAQAAASGRTPFEQWAVDAAASENPSAQTLGDLASRLIQSRASWRAVVRDALRVLVQAASPGDTVSTDVLEDKAAWDAATRAVRAELGDNPDLPQLLQGLALRPKEPPPERDSVALHTIHSAKGLEFDHVWVVGLAESVMPSWQSLKEEAKPAELEEERRGCFVAVTRTKKSLTLSRAKSYRGRDRDPSRFLLEMGLAEPPDSDSQPTA